MKIIILAGFLGSGKTTVLLQLVKYLVGLENNNPESLVIIENEIGAANVDGKALQGKGYAVRDLTAGCICCTLTGDLLAAMDEIEKDINPQWVVIEATGVAFQKIADILGQKLTGPPAKTLALADAERWDELIEAMPMLISRQIEGADLVLINKTDLVGKEALVAIEAEVKEIAGLTPCYSVSALNDDLTTTWSILVN